MVYPLNYKEINKALKCFNQTKLCGDDYPQQGFEPKGTTFFAQFCCPILILTIYSKYS